MKATVLKDRIYYMNVKGHPEQINQVYDEVEKMVEKGNIKRDLDNVYIFSISQLFVNDLAEYLLKKYKLITIRTLKA